MPPLVICYSLVTSTCGDVDACPLVHRENLWIW